MVQYSERTDQVPTYLEDTYRFEADTTVITTGEREGVAWVAVRDNIFHPQGGGQRADSGWVGDVPVHPVRDHETGRVILTAAGAAHPLPALSPGNAVLVRVDKDVRLRHAALHTAGHLIEALVQPRQWQTVGNNHFPGEARVEFNTPDPAEVATAEDRVALTRTLTGQAADAIAAGLPTTAQTADDGTRYVTIESLHTVPCGGTHVASLSELAGFELAELRVKKGRIKASYTVEYGTRD